MEPSLHQCRAAAVMHAVKLLAGEERKNTTHVLTSNASRKLQLWLISKLGRMKDGPAAFEGLYIERGMSLWEAAIATSCSSGTLTPAVHIAKARTLRFEHGYPYIYIFLFIYLFILFGEHLRGASAVVNTEPGHNLSGRLVARYTKFF